MRFFCILFFCLFSLAGIAQDRILIDGRLGEWDSRPILYTDAAGDAGVSGIDFGELKITHDEQYVFFSLEVGPQINLQDNNNLTLYLDTDENAATGLAIAGIGAEVEYTLGTRSGFVRLPGTLPIYHDDIGLVTMPTVSSTRFEIAINRMASISSTPVFPSTGFKLVVRDNGGSGDVLPAGTGGVSYTFSDVILPSLPAYSLHKKQASDLRIISYNALSDGLFDSGRLPSFIRIFEALEPEIIGFQEIYDFSAQQVANQMENILPSGPGETWYFGKAGPDVHAISRYPILATYPIAGSNSGQGNGAFLIDLPDPATELLFIVAHTPCCSNDAGRDIEIDAIMAFVRNAKAGTGPLQLTADAPIIICGDMNLVGNPEQLASLQTGNIIDEGTFGPDFAPDWDGTDLADSSPYATGEPMAYTWYNEGSTFSPGKLDVTIYSDSRLILQNAFSLFTPSLPADSLTAYGLLGTDGLIASDHLPLVTDFEVLSTTAISQVDAGFPLFQLAPNPTQGLTNVSLTLPKTMPLRLSLYDMLGHQLSILTQAEYAAGNHEVQIDLGSFPGGMYLLRLEGEEVNVSRRVVVGQ